MHFPPTTVEKFQKAASKIAEAQQQQQQQQQAMQEDQAAQDMQAGLEVPGMPPINQGMNGAGMSPAPMQ
jgi:hypothetical protein